MDSTKSSDYNYKLLLSNKITNLMPLHAFLIFPMHLYSSDSTKSIGYNCKTITLKFDSKNKIKNIRYNVILANSINFIF